MSFKSLIMENVADVGVAGLDLKSQRSRAIYDAALASSSRNAKVEVTYEYITPKGLDLSAVGSIVGQGIMTAIVNYSNSSKKSLFKVTYPYVVTVNPHNDKVTYRVIDNGTDVEATCDDIMIKLDKKTSMSIASKLVKIMKTDSISKTYDITSTHDYLTIKNQFLDIEANKKREQEAERLLKKQNELAAFAKKYKVSVTRIAKGHKSAVAVFNSDIDSNDRSDIENLIGRYDTEVWAIDRGYQEAVKENEQIIKDLGKFGSGNVYYTTGPNNTDMVIKF